MINGYENKETYARFNHLIDMVRGNMPKVSWDKLTDKTKKLYLEEAEVAEYQITTEDVSQIETLLGAI